MKDSEDKVRSKTPPVSIFKQWKQKLLRRFSRSSKSKSKDVNSSAENVQANSSSRPEQASMANENNTPVAVKQVVSTFQDTSAPYVFDMPSPPPVLATPVGGNRTRFSSKSEKLQLVAMQYSAQENGDEEKVAELQDRIDRLNEEKNRADIQREILLQHKRQVEGLSNESMSSTSDVLRQTSEPNQQCFV